MTKDGKTVNYYLVQNDTSKAAHGAICGGEPEKVTVTGTVKKKDGKEIVTPTKIEPGKILRLESSKQPLQEIISDGG